MKRNLVAALVFGLIILYSSLCSAMKISVLDVGQGDSILIESETQNILVDTGPPESRDKLMAALANVDKIDKLILTHPHADHIGNAFYLLENFPVEMAYDNGAISASSYYLNYLAGLSMENISRVTLTAGDKLTVDGAEFEILNPSATFDTNNDSLVIRLVYGNFSMLFTGDIGFMAEAEILSQGKNISSTVLKAAHHGAKTSSSYNFLQAVNPKAVIISCGLNNKFGHPSPDALTSYLKFTDKIFNTAFNGDVVINTDGTTYSITPKFSSDWLSKAKKSNQLTIVQKLDGK